MKCLMAWVIAFTCFFLPSIVNPSDSRIITAGICLDEECQKEKGWDFFYQLFEDISADFEKEFRIRLSPHRYQSWESQNQVQSLDGLFQLFVTGVSKDGFNMVLGVTGQSNLQGPSGVSLYQEAYVLVKYCDNRQRLKKLFKHEICHLLGAAHVDDKNSLMDRFLRGNELDKENRKIIFLHRERNFDNAGFPLSHDKQMILIDLYQKIADSNECLRNSSLALSNRKRMRKKLLSKAFKKKDSHFIQKVYSGLEDVYTYLSLLFLETKKYDKAIEVCQRILKINPDLFEAYNLMGIAHRRSCRIQEAIRCYKKVLHLCPNHPKVNYNLGIAHMKNGDVEQAVAFYRKAIDINPYFSDPWNNLGYVDLEQGRLDQAIEKFEKAIELNPFLPLAHSNLAEGLLRKGQVDRALENVKKALALDSELPGPYNILGNIYSKKNELQKAEKEYKTAISIEPNYYKAYFNLGNIYFKKNQLSQACYYFRKSIEIFPEFGLAYSGLGDCYLLMGKLDRADRVLKRACDLGYGDVRVYLNLSYIKIKQKDFDNAIVYADKVISCDPSLETAHQNLGIAYFMKGMLTQAEKSFKVVLGLNPKQADMHKNLMMIYLLKKDWGQAIKHLNIYEQLGFQVNEELKKEVLRHLEEKDK